MAGFDRFMIAPFNIGLETDLKPWMIPDEAFAELNNAYVFRGRVRKRFGSTLMGTGWPTEDVAHLYSRFRIALAGGAGIGITDGTGVAAGTVPGAIFKVGQSFSIGTVIFTVVTAGAGVQMLRTDGSIEAATFDTTTGAYSITIAALPATQVYFYPSDPVMGLTQYESGTVNNQPTFGFDTQFAYNFTGGYWVRSGPAAVWHGTDLNFFWATNWTGISADKTNMFVTNFQVANKNGAVVAATDDPIWVYDATTGWATFSPKFLVAGAGNIVSTARIIVPFKDRLLLLNTIEQNAAGTVNASYPNRCRFSHNGSPFPAATAWLEPNQVGADGAGWIDAPTEEEIVSAGFIKDRLIVYFERSTWELAYTGNQILPFVWQKLNTELGSEAEFSTVPFDKTVLTIGNTGVHACNGSNVERIDSVIPQEVFQIRDKDEGVSRVAGVRDYYTEMVYWTFPSANQPATQTYPNKVLVYNYRNNAWATNDDCITAFGFFEQQSDDTWADEDIQWQEADFAWDAGAIQSQFRQVIAGNQQGYTFVINTGVARNAPVMLITNMAYNAATGETTLTVLDHTLDAGEFIKIEHTANIPGIYKVNSIKSKDTIGVISADPGIYAGGGTVARVSNLSIKSKQWNPYVDKDFSFHLAKIDFNVDKTTHGEVTVDYAPSYSRISMLDDAYNSGALLGTGVLETRPLALVPLETVQDQLWHAVFLQTDGDSVQIIIKMSDDQMVDDNISSSGFELNAMILYTRKTSTRL
jgi:hypothetical protein